MAFLVEDGTGLVVATSYIDVAYADSYHTDRQTTIWTSETDQAKKESALIRATQYIDAKYGQFFNGNVLKVEQGLLWPRVDAQYTNGQVIVGIPEVLKKATAELASRAITSSDLMPDINVVTHGPNVLEVTEKVDVIETRIKYATATERTTGQIIDGYPFITSMLLPIIGAYDTDASDYLVGLDTYGINFDSSFVPSVTPPAFTLGQFDN